MKTVSIVLFALLFTGCVGSTVAWNVGTNNVHAAATTATSRSAAQNSGGESNNVHAVDVAGSGGIDATIPLSEASAVTSAVEAVEATTSTEEAE